MHFNSFVLVSLLSITALAVPHNPSSNHHRAIAARHARSEAAAEALPHVGKKRSLTKRCKTRKPPVASSTQVPTTSPTTSSSSPPAPSSSSTKKVETTKKPEPSSTKEPEPEPTTSTKKPEPEPTTKAEPEPETTKTTKSTTPKPTSGSSSGGGDDSGLFFSLTGLNKGQGTFYNTGLTACGGTFQDTDFIAAVSHEVFDAYPGAGANPNNNPICGKKIKATYNGKSVTVAIQDRCGGCATNKDVDFTPSAFSQLAPFSVGRLMNLDWQFV